MNSNQQIPNPVVHQSQSAYADEISLIDIVRVLLRRKKLIIGITIIAVSIGLVYAFSQERVYQVETILLPPSHEDVQALFEDVEALNVFNSDSENNRNSIFASFTASINSRRLRQSFFNDYKLIETLSGEHAQPLTTQGINDVFEEFSKLLNVKVDKKSNSTTITLEGTHKEKIGVWLDALVVMANQDTVNHLVRDLQSNIDSKINSIKLKISSKRSVYKKRREDALGRLQEAFHIAKELGIHDHLFVPNVDGAPSRMISAKLNNISKSLSNEDNLSTYMKGTKVLQAEINALKKRRSDDIHIAGLRDLQEELTRLESIKIASHKLKAVTVDKKATVDIDPVRPNRKLIAMLSLILGGMLGIFSAFILELMRKLKEQVDDESDFNPA